VLITAECVRGTYLPGPVWGSLLHGAVLLLAACVQFDVRAAGAEIVSIDGVTTVRRACGAPGGGGGLVPPLRNGSFSQGLSDWTAEESGGSVSPGGVAADAGAAVLREGDSFLVTLSQTFTVPPQARSLSFKVNLEPGFDASDASIPDAFEISVLDQDLDSIVGSWSDLATSFLNFQETGAVLAASGVVWAGGTATVNLRSVPEGSVVTLYFDLIGADGDVASAVRIDDIELDFGPQEGLLRGDVDGSGIADADDPPAILAWLFEKGPAPLGCKLLPEVDAADANDNERVTVGDFLFLRHAVAVGAQLPEPSRGCGADPDDDLGGFGRVDQSFRIVAGDVVVEPPAGVKDRTVTLPILLDTPSPVLGITLILQFDAATLTPLDPTKGEAPPFSIPLGPATWFVEGDRIVAALWADPDGQVLLDARPGVPQPIGSVTFHLADFEILRNVRWAPEAEIRGVVFRTTVVDGTFEDHLPELPGGEFEFVRGNANGDTTMDITDPIVTLNFLFLGGEGLTCLDAADGNNDGAVDVTDAIYVLNFLFLGGATIPRPYPACGFDEGEIDDLGCSPCSCPPYPEGDPCP